MSVVIFVALRWPGAIAAKATLVTVASSGASSRKKRSRPQAARVRRRIARRRFFSAALPVAVVVVPALRAVFVVPAVIEMRTVGIAEARRLLRTLPAMPVMIAVPIAVVIAERDVAAARRDDAARERCCGSRESER